MSYIYFHKSGTVETINTKPGASAPKVAGVGKSADGTHAPGDGSDKTKQTDGTNAGTTADSTPVSAWAIIERHKVVHYSIGGGFVMFRATQHTYAVNSVQSTTTT